MADRSLVGLQKYSRDPATIMAAIDKVATSVTALSDSQSDKAAVPGDPAPQGLPGPPEIGPGELMAKADSTWAELTERHTSLVTTSALLAVTSSLSLVPGRKSVLFFAEGVPIPPDARGAVESIVATANRANVTIDTVDAAGLRVHSIDEGVAHEVRTLGHLGVTNGSDGSNSSSLRSLERNETVLLSDPRGVLGDLANETGGYFIRDTNDLTQGLRRIDADMQSYYLVSYIPTNGDLDGRWRKIELKLTRPVGRLQYRTRYLAVPASVSASMPIFANEAPAIAALDSGRSVAAVPLRMSSFTFPSRVGARLSIVGGLDQSYIRFVPSSETPDTLTTDATVVVRVKDVGGAVVARLSHRFQLRVASANLATARRGEARFERTLDGLAAGRYTVEAAVFDALANTLGTSVTTCSIPLRPPADVGTLALVAGVSPADPDNSESPWRVGDALLLPSTTNVVHRAQRNATLLIDILPEPSQPLSSLTLRLRREDTTVGETVLTPGSPNPSGVIQELTQVPIETLQDGVYEFVLIAAYDGHVEQRVLRWTLVD